MADSVHDRTGDPRYGNHGEVDHLQEWNLLRQEFLKFSRRISTGGRTWGPDTVDVLSSPGEEAVLEDPAPMEEDPATPKANKKAIREKEAEIARLQSRVEELELEKAAGKGKEKVPPLKLSPPALFTGKRGSFEYFASKLKSFAELTRVPETKWVALAVQQLDEKPTKVWEAHKKGVGPRPSTLPCVGHGSHTWILFCAGFTGEWHVLYLYSIVLASTVTTWKALYHMAGLVL